MKPALDPDVTAARRVLRDILSTRFSKEGLAKLDAEQRTERARRIAAEIVPLFLESGLKLEHMDLVVDILGEPLPTQMHWSMFLRTLQTLASDEQREYWLPRCVSGEVIGCYAQTELGWGSDISSLETTATRQEDGFVLHSPTPRSLKAWPGGLGSTATHALVIARERHPPRIRGGVRRSGLPPKGLASVDRTPYSPLGAALSHFNEPEGRASMRMFIVDLASPGVTRGSMGRLMGFQGADNGWMHLDHVCIPAANALPSGRVKSVLEHTRGRIVRASFFSLAKALTIARRYAAIREQPRGTRVIDHPHVRLTLLRWTAFAEALGSGEHTAEMAFKAYVTDEVARGIEACRRICGGFGYARFSGFPELLENHLASVTYEGSNEMLYARSEARSGKSHAATLADLAFTPAFRGGTLEARIDAFDISAYECGGILAGARDAEDLYARLWRELGVVSHI